MDANAAQAMVDRLVQATNDHDAEAVAACFAEDYENQTPVHPARGFRGRAQVRQNWEQIFAFVSDLRAEVISSAIDGDTAWTEWEMTGTRRDGTAHEMRGVVLLGCARGSRSGLGSTSSPSIRVRAGSRRPCAGR